MVYGIHQAGFSWIDILGFKKYILKKDYLQWIFFPVLFVQIVLHCP